MAKFRLLGVDMSLSINEFNILLGFIDSEAISSPEYMNSACDYGQPFSRDYIDIWREWSVDKFTYNPSKSKSSYLKDPVLRYIHKFLAFNFSRQKDAYCILSKAEFYFLWCMVNNVKVNFGCWLATQLQTVLTKPHKPLILGSIITHIAHRMCDLFGEDFEVHIAGPTDPLDLACLERLGVIHRIQDQYQFAPPGKLRLRPPASIILPPVAIPAATSFADDAGPSTSKSCPPSKWDAQFQSLHARIQQLDSRIANIELQSPRIAKNLAAYFVSMGFSPPLPRILDLYVQGRSLCLSFALIILHWGQCHV